MYHKSRKEAYMKTLKKEIAFELSKILLDKFEAEVLSDEIVSLME